MRSDTGPFVVIPVWVLDLPLSLYAFKLYAIHADWADRGGEHWHGRKALAERLGCSLDTVDRAHDELVRNRALRVVHQKSPSGAPTSNRYAVCRVHPGVAAPQRLGSRSPAARGSRWGAALVLKKEEPIPPTPHASETAARAEPPRYGQSDPPGTVRPREWHREPPVTDEDRCRALARIRALRGGRPDP